MTRRRFAPWAILAIAIVALYINFPRQLTGIDLPLPDRVRTVLGLDLQGGIQVTLEVVSDNGEPVAQERV